VALLAAIKPEFLLMSLTISIPLERLQDVSTFVAQIAACTAATLVLNPKE